VQQATQVRRLCVNECIKWNNNAKKRKLTNSKIFGCLLSWDEQPPFITHDEKCMKSMSETKKYVWLQKYWILRLLKRKKKTRLIKGWIKHQSF
jgi:hypothetical protein